MLEVLLFFEFLKNIFNFPYTNDNLSNINSIQTSNTSLVYEEFKKIDKEERKIEIDKNKLSAKNVLIKEIDNRTLFENNSQEKKPIASLTKFLTAVVAFKNYDKEEIFNIEQKFITNENAEKHTQFKPGEKYTRDQLINIMLISSSNIAAWSLTEKLGEKKFIEEMNKIAKELGMNNSFFSDVVGLSEKTVSTLEDLFILIKNILRDYPEIIDFSRQESFQIINTQNENQFYFYNTNQLLKKYKNYILASKTGFTPQAGQCLLLLVKFPNSPLIFVGLLDSKDRNKDGEYLLQKLKEFYKQ